MHISSKLCWVAALLIGAGTHPTAFANHELAQRGGCLACHAVATKVVGPAYQDVAKKCQGQKDAEATVVNNIKKGGSGKWGPIPMPAQTALSDADAKALAKWILGLAK